MHSEGRRGVTTILNYALLITIVTLLVAGLLVGLGGFVESQQERAIRSQLDTVGNSLAADVETASRLAGTANGDQIRLRSELPDTVGGSQYRVGVNNLTSDSNDNNDSSYRYELVLVSSQPTVRVTVTIRSAVPVTGTVSGGQVVVTYDSDAGELEVTDV